MLSRLAANRRHVAARTDGIGAGQILVVTPKKGHIPKARTDSPEPSCRIKGNISGSGERVYHVPGGRDYGRTQINLTKGERWFCSEADARAAGWRRANP